MKKLLMAALGSSVGLTAQANDDNRLVIEEVIVNAQKREQSALVVPVTVDTFSVNDIINTGALSLQDIDDYIPGFESGGETITQQGYRLRGVSSPNISTGGDPSVATFYDDVYLPRAATTVAFSDMARIEVLKGPQGTLFGRNAAAGVINMVPNAPSEEYEGFVSARLGNEQFLRVEGMVNLPLTDSVSLRINALGNQKDGFVDQLGDARFEPGYKENQSFRVAARWEISDDSRAQLAYDWDRIDQAPTMAIGFSEFAYSRDPFAGKVENDVNLDQETRDMFGFTGKFWHDFSDSLSLKLIASYRDFDTSNREDEDGTADATRYFDTDNIEDSDIVYTELQLNYTADKFDVVMGANYSKEDTFQTTWSTALADSIARLVTEELNGALGTSLDHMWNADEFAAALNGFGFPVTEELILATGDEWYEIVSGVVPQVAPDLASFAPMVYGPSFAGSEWRERITNTGDFTNWGVYFDINYEVNDKLNLLAGLRYSEDRKTFSWLIPVTTFNNLRPGVSNQIFQLPAGYESAAITPLSASDSWNKVTGRLVAQYQIDEGLMTYLSYSTGYKSGGFDSLDITTSEFRIEPEESTMIEWGLKGDVIEDRLRLQLAVFQLEVDDRQRTVESRQPEQDNAIPKVINGDQQFDGFELTLDWLPSDSLLIGLVTTARDEESVWQPFYNSDAQLIEESDKDDTALEYTVKLDWTPDIAVGSLLVHIDYIYRENDRSRDDDDFFPEYESLPRYFDDTRLLNARIAWTSPDSHYEVALWSRNLLDEELITGVRTITRSAFGTPFVGINEPRSYGIEGRYSF